MKAKREAKQVLVKVYKADVTVAELEFYVAAYNDIELKRSVKATLRKCGDWQYAEYVWQGQTQYLFDEAGISKLSSL